LSVALFIIVITRFQRIDEDWYNVTPLVKKKFGNKVINKFSDTIFANLIVFLIEITLYQSS